MPRFLYRTIDAQGTRQSGTMEAATREAIVDHLQSQGHVPISVSPAEANFWVWLNQEVDLFGGVSKRDIAEFTKQLATLLEAGLVLDRSLGILAVTSPNKYMRKMVEKLQLELREGETFAAALNRQKKYFPTFYVAMVRAGETSGQLASILTRLGAMLERSAKFQASITGALIYPAILLTLVTITLIVVVTLVLPQFADVFDDAGAQLPLATRITMAIGEGIRGYWWAILGAVLLMIFALRTAWRRTHIRVSVYRRLLDRPVFRNWVLASDCVRFTRTFGTLLQSGQAIASAMRIAGAGIINDAFKEDIENGLQYLKQGRRLPQVFVSFGYLPHVMMQLCYVGDETGKLGLMLQRAADVMEDQIEIKMQRFLAVFAPIITLILGGLVAGLIGSLILGMMSINTIIG